MAITEEQVNKAFEERFDGVEKFLLVQKILETEAELDKHRWIPVSERLPKDDHQVWILYDISEYTYNAYYDSVYNNWHIFDYSGGYKKAEDKPTHWKPIILPKGA